MTGSVVVTDRGDRFADAGAAEGRAGHLQTRGFQTEVTIGAIAARPFTAVVAAIRVLARGDADALEVLTGLVCRAVAAGQGRAAGVYHIPALDSLGRTGFPSGQTPVAGVRKFRLGKAALTVMCAATAIPVAGVSRRRAAIGISAPLAFT